MLTVVLAVALNNPASKSSIDVSHARLTVVICERSSGESTTEGHYSKIAHELSVAYVIHTVCWAMKMPTNFR